MLELAKVYLISGDLDSCQSQCISLLKKDKENDAATIVSSIYLFIYFFSLVKCPNVWFFFFLSFSDVYIYQMFS